MRTNSLILSLLILLFWGIWGFLAKYCVSKFGKGRTFVWSQAGFLSLLVIWAFFFRKGNLSIKNPYHLLPLITYGALAFLPTILFYRLLEKSPASIAVPLTALYPGITVLLSVFILGEKIKLLNLLGIILALIAGFLIAI